MPTHAALSTDRNTTRYRRILATGLLLSVAVHAAMFLLWRGAPPPFERKSEASGPAPSLDPGGAMMAMNVRLPRPLVIPPPPAPRLSPDAPRVELLQLEEATAAPSTARLTFAGGGDAGRGESDGDAEGDGGGGDRFTAPVPRSLVPAWDAPREVKGLRVTVRVYVDATGEPTGDVELEPPTPNRRFNDILKRKVREMRYHPARRNGKPVPGWAEITFVF